MHCRGAALRRNGRRSGVRSPVASRLRDGSLITAARHRIECVHHCDDARADRNLLEHKPVRVPLLRPDARATKVATRDARVIALERPELHRSPGCCLHEPGACPASDPARSAGRLELRAAAGGRTSSSTGRVWVCDDNALPPPARSAARPGDCLRTKFAPSNQRVGTLLRRDPLWAGRGSVISVVGGRPVVLLLAEPKWSSPSRDIPGRRRRSSGPVRLGSPRPRPSHRHTRARP